jgi:hypothetical protein
MLFFLELPVWLSSVECAGCWWRCSVPHAARERSQRTIGTAFASGIRSPTNRRRVPTGYGADRPRTERDGTWFTDQRDGKRLFVPKQGVRGWQPGVLAGEAKKATGFDGKPRLTAGEKAWWGTTALFGAMAGVKVPPPD